MHPLAPIIVPINRVAHLLQEHRRLQHLEQCIATIRREHKRCGEQSLHHFARLHNISLYLLVIDHDFSVLKTDSLFAIRKWKKNYLARQLSLLIYEVSQNLPKLLGKKFRSSLKELPLTQGDSKTFNNITSNLNEFKQNNRTLLNRIRNHAVAHRDRDAAEQLKIIETVSLHEMLSLAGNLYHIINDLLYFLIRCTQFIDNPAIIIRHLMLERRTD